MNQTVVLPTDGADVMPSFISYSTTPAQYIKLAGLMQAFIQPLLQMEGQAAATSRSASRKAMAHHDSFMPVNFNIIGVCHLCDKTLAKICHKI